MHAAIADLETKKLHAEKELIEFEKASSRSEGVLHHLAAQRFASVIDIQLLASRATTEMKGLEKASDEEVFMTHLPHTLSTTFSFVYYSQPTNQPTNQPTKYTHLFITSFRPLFPLFLHASSPPARHGQKTPLLPCSSTLIPPTSHPAQTIAH